MGEMLLPLHCLLFGVLGWVSLKNFVKSSYLRRALLIIFIMSLLQKTRRWMSRKYIDLSFEPIVVTRTGYLACYFPQIAAGRKDATFCVYFLVS